MRLIVLGFGACALIGACKPTPVVDKAAEQRLPGDEPGTDSASSPSAPSAPSVPHGGADATARAPLVGQDMVLAAWAKAGNRRACAPLAFVSDAGGGGVPRRADFSDGWGVAFDQPGLRGAYGVAGPGVLPADQDDVSKQRRRLSDQWPHFRELAALPQPAFAGYGLSGARPYPATNVGGRALHSLAYVRIGGQICTYNVWSRISRAHLEALLDNLRIVPHGD